MGEASDTLTDKDFAMASFPKVSTFRDKQKASSDGGDKVGKTTKLLLTHAVCELLVWNEKAKETDDVLKEMLETEFPLRRKAGEKAAKKGEGNTDRPRTLQAVSAYRGYYNAGKHGFGDGTNAIGEKPRLLSSSYNAEGVARVKSASNGKPAKAKKATKKAAAKGGKAAAKKATKKATEQTA